jgi:hypothetical protein
MTAYGERTGINGLESKISRELHLGRLVLSVISGSEHHQLAAL